MPCNDANWDLPPLNAAELRSSLNELRGDPGYQPPVLDEFGYRMLCSQGYGPAVREAIGFPPAAPRCDCADKVEALEERVRLLERTAGPLWNGTIWIPNQD